LRERLYCTEAHCKRHAQNVHARVSTNERTPFQSRPRQYEICAGNGLLAHEGLTSRKELFRARLSVRGRAAVRQMSIFFVFWPFSLACPRCRWRYSPYSSHRPLRQRAHPQEASKQCRPHRLHAATAATDQKIGVRLPIAKHALLFCFCRCAKKCGPHTMHIFTLNGFVADQFVYMKAPFLSP